jgi:hypothetical protein
MKNKKIKILLFIAITLTIVGGVIVWMRLADVGPFAKETGTTTGSDGINYGPPTDEELQQTEDHKNSLGDQKDKDSGQKDNFLKVVPFISIAQQMQDSQYGDVVIVRAYVSEIVESGGACTITFTKDGKTFTKTVSGQPDASTTNCDTVMIPRSEFSSAGKWSVTVSYKSAKASGASQPTEVEVK